MYTFKNSLILVLIGFLVVSCSDFLNFQPKGNLSEEDLNTPENVDKLTTAAYAALGNDHWFVPYSHMWAFGSVRSDDAYKGGLGTSDIGDFHRMELLSTIRTDMVRSNQLWERLYKGVDRANTALKRLNNVSESELPVKTQRQAEMRFIRGHFHFVLKTLYKRIPYIDETIPVDSLGSVSNRQYSNNELWNKIAEDFQFAVDNLPMPAQVGAVGRADQLDAKAYLAKVRLYQAYEQNENHQVVNINTDHLEEVLTLTNDIMTASNHGLFDDFAQNFLWEYENGQESLFSVQRSRDDGTPDGRMNRAVSLLYPMYDAYGCCSFSRPSQTLVNAFQTTQDGLPDFDGYNNDEMDEEQDFQNNTFDPRLDHTVGLPGHPYKYQNDIIYDVADFTRATQVYGPFSTMKAIQQVDCPCLVRSGGSGFSASSKNNDIIKYNDVLLWRAEALIELGRHDEALPIINDIRSRAQASTGRLVDGNGNSYSNYHIETYQDGVNINWTQENARRALRWERRLEFAMEGMRFFDLVRWGIADETMNEYFGVEENRRVYLGNGQFTEGQHEYLPIPEQQIDFSEGVYEQNTGY